MRFFSCLTLIVCLALTSPLGLGATEPPDQNSSIQNLDLSFSLPRPESPAHQAYLGVKNQDTFTLDQIQADILIVEIFSMYCPICQREAKRVNTLYEKLSGVTDRQVKLIGIGAGNSAYEVDFFKETYGIEFPLFSDGEFVIHKKIGERGTPFFIAIDRSAPETNTVFFTHSGDIGDLDAFFNQLVTPSKAGQSK